MSERAFTQVDVFSAERYLGNPLAVVLDAEGLSEERMQRFAHWTNLSETTFLLPPTDPAADYRVRIYTTSEELPFAGHPTLGSAHAWREAGGLPKHDGVIVQECGIGLVTVRTAGDRLAFAAPPLIRFESVDEAILLRIAAGFGISRSDIVDSSWLVNGPQWIGIRLASAADVLALKPDASVLRGLFVGVIGPHRDGSEPHFEVRAFATMETIVEDPVTGSLNAGLAQWLTGNGTAPARYIAAQGTAIGRAGRVHIEAAGDDVWVGGDVTTNIRGTVEL